MIKINLLSPLDKENLKWEKMNNLVRRGIIRIIIAEALFAAVFFSAAGYLNAQRESIGSQLADMRAQDDAREMNKMETDLNNFKGKINDIDYIQKNHLQWTYLFENITALVPDGVKLESVSVSDAVDKTKKTDKKNTSSGNGAADTKSTAAADDKLKVEIGGRADAREDLLNFEGNLKKSEVLSDFQYDDANYVESANINFHYVLYVNREKLAR
jgi:Tfp pilus assembly protein PilN